jgi:3-phosphoshikimate 1-carboxyvinyltransferase
MIQEFEKISRVNGKLDLPGDKSISHRSVMFSSLANGKSVIYNCLMSEDVISTIKAFRSLGCNIELSPDKITIIGHGINGLRKPSKELYLGNSGTTTRLIAGILASQNFLSVLSGDQSLSSRPMQRIIDPLTKMGAQIESNNGLLPMKINPVKSLNAIEYDLPIASAQIKSCVLLAGLFLEEETIVIEHKKSRDHTEKMLNLKIDEFNDFRKIYSSSKNYPIADEYFVPSDISTAAFFIVLTLLSENSELLLPNVSLNETRTGLIKILRDMGGIIETQNERILNGEIRGDLIVKSSKLINMEVPPDLIPNIIDEIPILSIAGLFAEGDFTIRNASELRHKESDRIRSVCENLKLIGVDVEEFEDGFKLSGMPTDARVSFESFDDHRIAMSFSILSLLLEQGGSIENFECVNISNPDFLKQLHQIVS